MKTVVIIASRFGSSRFHGKALVLLEGKPILQWVIEACSRARSVDEVVVALPDRRTDDELLRWCRAAGSTLGFTTITAAPSVALGDVQGRVWHAAELVQADVVVRVNHDSPFISPDRINTIADYLIRARLDYAYYRINGQPSINTRYALPEAIKTTLLRDLVGSREHVTQQLWKTYEGITEVDALDLKMEIPVPVTTIDYPEDLEAAHEALRRDRSEPQW